MTSRYYSPSINIIRDKQLPLEYIPTRNGEMAFNSILNAYQNGIKCFYLMGAYGTGKSAFILAFERVLKGESNYFNYANSNERIDSKLIIGEYSSFEQQIKAAFKIRNGEDVLRRLKTIFSKYKRGSERLLLVIDEFGKNLEYAAANSAEKEMFFLQKLAELINTKELNVLLLTTLHQPFEGYSSELSDHQKREWKKVSGRYYEVPFNEPVEQLLFLAGEHIKQLNLNYTGTKAEFNSLFDAIKKSKAFPLKAYFTKEFALDIYPFDLLSASTLILAFQQYGQNERSLFNFLKADDYLGINDFRAENEFFSLPKVYDYLIHNYQSSLSSKFNPHNLHWRALRDAVTTAESYFIEDLSDILKIIKTIGLLNIFGKLGQKINPEFLTVYGSIALNISNVIQLLELLEQRQLIRFQSFNSRYVLFKGSDFDITQALVQAETVVSKDFNFIERLNKYFTFPILQAKKSYYEKGTPRYFEFKLTEAINDYETTDSIDGYIQLIINEDIDENKLAKHSNSKNPILHGWLSNSSTLREIIFEIEKVKWVKDQAIDDSVVQKEMNSNLEVLIDKLNNHFFEGFYGKNSTIKWFYRGENLTFSSSKELNKQLSIICDDCYPDVPIFKNESINRQKIQGTISSARKTLISHLLLYENEKHLGFDENYYPPQRTIYQSLIEKTGIHRKRGISYQLMSPSRQDFLPLWKTCEDFFNDCSASPKNLSSLIQKLKQRPLGLKMGFIETWIPIFLIVKKHEFAFYEDDTFIPELAEGTIDIALRQPHKYYIHTFKLTEERTYLFNQYRYFLNQVETSRATRETFIETVKPFLSFYKRLPEYTQQTENISINAVRLKSAIKNAKDAEKVFFEDIPRALGFSGNDLSNKDEIEQFAIKLKDATSEISSALSQLFDKVESVINFEIGDINLDFPANKEKLQRRFQKLRINELDTKQKVFYQRVVTALDDRKSWISSVAVAVVNKTLDKFTDKDYEMFKSKYSQFVHELDNMTELSKTDIDLNNEEILKLEISSFVKGVQNKLVRLPKVKENELKDLEKDIKPFLNKNNKQDNIALLIRLLQNELENE